MATSDVWFCPICGVEAATPADVMAHGREEHPSVLPAHATIAQRLALIAALADEAALTAGHPNPDGQQVRARRPLSGRCPADLSAVDLAAPPDDDHPERPLSLLVECSRLCWDATPLDVHQAHPQPDPPCTLASEARWLAALWPAAQPWPDLADCDWIDDSTRQVGTHWGDPSRPSIVSRADAVTKQIAAIGWLADSPVVLEKLGYTQAEIDRLMADKKRAEAGTTLDRLTALTQPQQQPTPAQQPGQAAGPTTSRPASTPSPASTRQTQPGASASQE